jgi:uncharacterized protein (TIGR02996 family)
MTTEADLIRGVLAAPKDDAPRLALADWYAENGDEARGEFVRVGVELARTKVHPNGHTDVGPDRRFFVNEARDCTRADCRACELRRRERNLLQQTPPGGELPYRLVWAGFDSYTATTGIEWTFRRGLVSSVTLPLAAFVGGPCGQCRGAFLTSAFCSACSGTGTAPGLAARLFAAHPVTAVMLSDREPIAVSGRRLFGWISWYGECQMPHQIPSDLDALLPEPPPETLIAVPGLYPSAGAANLALSTACVAFGRAAAGLPPL